MLGNLLGVDLPDGTEIDYVVDPVGRRIGRKVDGVLERGWLYQDGLNPVAELDGTGAVVSRFVYGTRANVPEYMVKGGVTYRIVADELGSVRLVVDVATGTVVQELRYDAWGRVLVDTNPGFQPFGYAGGLYDAATGLVRFGARDYDASATKLTSFPRFPVITGEESQAEQYRLGRQLGQWRSAWLKRLYGGWAIVAVPVVLFGGRYGWGIAAMTLLAVLVLHILIQARVLAAIGQKGYALFHRVMAVYTALGLVVGLVLWIMAIL